MSNTEQLSKIFKQNKYQ